MHDKKISIVIPVYNVDMYIETCIRSVINQTYRNLEIIMVDDGSTDRSGDICDYYAESDDRVTVIHQNNQGLVRARKTGLKKATGDYVANVDGDDWVEENYIEVMLNNIDGDVDYVQCGFIYENSMNKKFATDYQTIELNENTRKQLYEAWLEDADEKLGSQMFNKLFKRELICRCYECVDDEYTQGEDLIAFTYYFAHASRIVLARECLYHYRIRENSLSHNKDGITLMFKEDRLTAYMYELIKKTYPDINIVTLNNWVIRRKYNSINNCQSIKNIHLNKYIYPEAANLCNKKVVIYGAGNVGQDYVQQLSMYENIEIVLWVDKNWSQYSYEWRRVKSPQYIDECEFDCIIIAVLNEKVARTIIEELHNKYNIDSYKLNWEKPELIV